VPDVFAYTGYRRIIYFKFLDLQSGHTLVADPGGQYEIMATESGISVPPGDGLWTSLLPPVPLAIPPPEPKVKEPVKAKEAPRSLTEKAGE